MSDFKPDLTGAAAEAAASAVKKLFGKESAGTDHATIAAKLKLAMGAMTADEIVKMEEKVADHVHANGMYGYGTGAHLGGDAHRLQIATSIIGARDSQATIVSVAQEGDDRYSHYYGGGLPDAQPAAATQHTGDEYSKRYGSYKFPAPGGGS